MPCGTRTRGASQSFQAWLRLVITEDPCTTESAHLTWPALFSTLLPGVRIALRLYSPLTLPCKQYTIGASLVLKFCDGPSRPPNVLRLPTRPCSRQQASTALILEWTSKRDPKQRIQGSGRPVPSRFCGPMPYCTPSGGLARLPACLPTLKGGRLMMVHIV